MNLLTSDMQHTAWTLSLLGLYRKSPSLSSIRLKPPLIIFLRRFWYVTSNFSTFSILAWVRESAADKTLQKLDSGFKVSLRVLKEVGHGSKFCVCHLDTVINFSVSRVRFVFWEIYEPRYLNSVGFWSDTLQRLIIVSEYSSSRSIWFRIVVSVFDTLIQRS